MILQGLVGWSSLRDRLSPARWVSKTRPTLRPLRLRNHARRFRFVPRCLRNPHRTSATRPHELPAWFRFSTLEVTRKSVCLCAKGTFSPCGLSRGGVAPSASGPVTRGAHASFDLKTGCDTQTPKKMTGPGWPSGPSDKMAPKGVFLRGGVR